MSSIPYLGEVSIYPYNFAPRDWTFCHGQELSISQHSALYALLGNAFGGRNNVSFCLPDLRGRSVIGSGHLNGYYYTRGDFGGQESVRMSTVNMPGHTHQVDLQCTAGLGATNEDGDQAAPGPDKILAKDVDTTGGAHPVMAYAERSKQNTTLGGLNVTAAAQCQVVGEGKAFNIQNPYMVLSYCIALTGDFPPRS
jgi:microcystin-dependent protein